MVLGRKVSMVIPVRDWYLLFSLVLARLHGQEGLGIQEPCSREIQFAGLRSGGSALELTSCLCLNKGVSVC